MPRKPKPTPEPRHVVDPAYKPLTPRQRKFALLYLECGVVAKACRDAGYAPRAKGKGGDGWRLRHLPHVRRFIEEERQKQNERLRLSADRVVASLLAIAEADISDMYDGKKQLPMEDWPPEFRRALADVEIQPIMNGKKKVGEQYQPRFQDRLEALRMLGQHLRMFAQTVEHTGPNGAPISIESAKERLIARIMEMRANGDPELTTIEPASLPAHAEQPAVVAAPPAEVVPARPAEVTQESTAPVPPPSDRWRRW